MKIISRRHAPGTAPGTLSALEPPAHPTRARYAEFGEDTIVEATLEHPDELPGRTAGLTQWLDLEGTDPAVITTLGERLSIHPLALEDVVNTGQRSKVENLDNAVFVVLDRFYVGADGRTVNSEQVSLVVEPNVVLSVRELPSDIFEPVRERLRIGKPRIRKGGSGYLAYALIDTVVDHLFPVLEFLGGRIEAVEDALLDDPSPRQVAEMHQLRHELLFIRKSVWPLREMLNGLYHSDDDVLNDETLPYLRDVLDHALVAVDIVEALRETVSSLMDLYVSIVSNRTNEIMKVLTIIATIFIPLSFITGLYGMNFDRSASPLNMPELGWYWGYPASLALMALVAGGLLIFFRRRGWF